MNKVVVLMSTFNGEKYIEEQIDSILNQENVDVELIVRDDGSTDRTIEILKKYKQQGKCNFYRDENKGAALSFIDLIFNAPKADYYSFSDQDDVWFSDKLISAIDKIQNFDEPVLYHGLAGRADEKLSPLRNVEYTPMHTFAGSLLTSATGCTMVFNNALMEILKSYRPNNISMHDAWVYRVCYAVDGIVIYDSESHMLYRQHNNNVSGGDMSLYEKIKRQLTKNKNIRWMTANELRKGLYNYIPDKNRELLNTFVSYRFSFINKMKIVFGKNFVAHKIKTTMQFKILFLFNFI